MSPWVCQGRAVHLGVLSHSDLRVPSGGVCRSQGLHQRCRRGYGSSYAFLSVFDVFSAVLRLRVPCPGS